MDEKNQEQQDSLQQLLLQGEIFEVLVREKGWEYIKKYFQTKIQNFANELLMAEDKKIEDFEAERRELIGIRKLLGWVDNSIKALDDEREKAKGSTKK